MGALIPKKFQEKDPKFLDDIIATFEKGGVDSFVELTQLDEAGWNKLCSLGVPLGIKLHIIAGLGYQEEFIGAGQAGQRDLAIGSRNAAASYSNAGSTMATLNSLQTPAPGQTVMQQAVNTNTVKMGNMAIDTLKGIITAPVGVVAEIINDTKKKLIRLWEYHYTGGWADELPHLYQPAYTSDAVVSQAASISIRGCEGFVAYKCRRFVVLVYWNKSYFGMVDSDARILLLSPDEVPNQEDKDADIPEYVRKLIKERPKKEVEELGVYRASAFKGIGSKEHMMFEVYDERREKGCKVIDDDVDPSEFKDL